MVSFFQQRNKKGEDALDIVKKYFINHKNERHGYNGKDLKNGAPEEKINYFKKMFKYADIS